MKTITETLSDRLSGLPWPTFQADFMNLNKVVYIISLFGDSNFVLFRHREIKHTAVRALYGISDMLQSPLALSQYYFT